MRPLPASAPVLPGVALVARALVRRRGHARTRTLLARLLAGSVPGGRVCQTDLATRVVGAALSTRARAGVLAVAEAALLLAAPTEDLLAQVVDLSTEVEDRAVLGFHLEEQRSDAALERLLLGPRLLQGRLCGVQLDL